MIEFAKIVVLGIIAAILYGIVHDQVTARVCIEYFTVFHPRIVNSQSPTVLAFAWGIAATWWAGFGVAIPIALFARLGNRPKLAARDLLKPAIVLLLAMAVLSVVAGLCGYWLGGRGTIHLTGRLAAMLPSDGHPRFLADLWAHQAAYAVGFFGSIWIWGWCAFRRIRLQQAAKRQGVGCQPDSNPLP